METTADLGERLSQQCSNCDRSSARCWCLDCNEALCDVCMSAHRRVTVTRSHRILNQPPAAGVSTSPIKFCRLHPSEPLKLFCFTCNQLTCRDCQLTAHMNHRYQFVSEALDSLKKQLEVLVHPIRVQTDTVRQSLLDMETRLQEIVQCESYLKKELQQSYSVIIAHLKKRMEKHLEEAKKVCELESERIQKRMMMVKQLHQKQHLATETAEKAKNSNNLSTLLTYTAQIESLMKDLPDQDLSPPPTMSQLKAVTNRMSLDAILNFGELEVSWIPFSVSQTSNQNRFRIRSASSSSPPTPTCPVPSCGTLPQTRTTSNTDSPVAPVPVNSLSSSNQLSLQPASCQSNQSNAPVATTTTVSSTQAVEHPSSCTVKTSSHQGTNPGQVLLQINPVQPASTSVSLQPVSVGFPPSADPSSYCTILQLVHPLMVLNQPAAPSQNQPAPILLTNTQTVDQVSRWSLTSPSNRPQLPMQLSQTASNTLPGNTWPKQQRDAGLRQIGPAAASHTALQRHKKSSNHQTLKEISSTMTNSPAASCRPLFQTRTTSITDSPVAPVPINCLALPQNSSSKQLCLPPSLSCSSSSDITPPTPNCLAPSCGTIPQTRTTCGTDSPIPVNCPPSLWKSSSNQLSPQPLSCPSNQSNAPETTTTTVTSIQTAEHPSSCTVKTLSHLETNPGQVLLQINPAQPVSTSVSLQPVSTHQNQSAANLLTNSQTVDQVSRCAFTQASVDRSQLPLLLSQTASDTLPGNTWLKQQKDGASHPAPQHPEETSNHQPPKDNSSTITSIPRSSDISPPSSSLKHQQQSPVVRAVADSACDHSVQQVASSQQEPAENEPTSTVSVEPEPAMKPSAPTLSDRDAEESSSVIGHTDCSLSQWKPRVSLFRLPVTPPRPGRPFPAFRLVRGDAEDEIYLKEMSKDTQSHVDDVTDDIVELLSSPESPVTLVMVACSACGSANGSIICSACGRGYHRDCHVPPVGPDIWSEWICSLCQDLTDPSDPYSSDRPRRPEGPGLSLLDQRRCESLLLFLKVEGCRRLPEFGRVWPRLKMMSERVTLRRSPAYQTAAELLSDVWSLFITSQDDDVLNKLQESFQSRLEETFRSELHPSVLMLPRGRRSTGRRPDSPPSAEMSHEEEERSKGSKVTSEKQKGISSEAKLKETKKRLREFLDLMGTPGSKRGRTDRMEALGGGGGGGGGLNPASLRVTSGQVDL